MSHHKRFLFFGNEWVSDIFKVKSLSVWSFCDELPDSFRSGGKHAWIIIILVIHAHIVISFRTINTVLTLRPIEICVEFRSLSWEVSLTWKLAGASELLVICTKVSIDLRSLSWELIRVRVLMQLWRVLSRPIEAQRGSLSSEGAVERGAILLMLLSNSQLRLLTLVGELGAIRGELSWGSIEGDISSVISGWRIVLLVVHINWL